MTTPKIDSYRFGQVVIDGHSYSNDVIVYPDHVQDRWWRAEGHSLAPEDLTAVLERPPEILVIGQGSAARMEVPEETLRRLRDNDIQVIAEPTADACLTYNRLRDKRRVIAALHLTC